MTASNASAIELLKKSQTAEESAFTKECEAALLDEEQGGASVEDLKQMVLDQAEYKSSMLVRHQEALASLEASLSVPVLSAYEQEQLNLLLGGEGLNNYSLEFFDKAYPDFKNKLQGTPGALLRMFLVLPIEIIRTYESSTGLISVCQIKVGNQIVRQDFLFPMSGMSKESIYNNLARLAGNYQRAIRIEAKLASATLGTKKRTLLED